MRVSSYKNWNPSAYLKEYYSTDQIAEDEICIYKFLIEFMRHHGDFDEMLDFGSGPTIHHIIPLVPHVNSISIADFLGSNLQEIRRWLNGCDDAHNWNAYFQAALRFEGSPADAPTVAKRAEDTRAKIRDLVRADIFKSDPLGLSKLFSLVTSFYCAECATSSKSKWRKGIENLSHLVAPRGWLVLSVVRQTTYYKSGDASFPSANISEDDLQEALVAAGFRSGSLEINAHSIKQWEREGFSAIMTARAQKI